MSEKYLDIHIIYSDKDKKYLVSLLKKCRNFRIKNSVNNWKISIKAHDNSGKNNIGQFQRRLSILKNYLFSSSISITSASLSTSFET